MRTVGAAMAMTMTMTMTMALSMPAVAHAAEQAQTRPKTQALRVSPQLLIGRWTDNGDCADFVEFAGNGQFTISSGGSGTWRLAGDRLTFTGASSVTVRVEPVSRDEVRLVQPDGSIGRSTRCPAARLAAGRVTMPPMPASVSAALAGAPVSAAHLRGRWTDDGDCSNAVTFHPDGRFILPGGQAGRWSLAGDRLTFSGGSTRVSRVRRFGNDRIVLVHQDNSMGQSVRCPS